MAWLLEKFGWTKIIGAVLAALLLFYLAAWPRITSWYYENKAERRTEQRDIARAETKVARKDEAQVARAGDITADTVAAQDTHAADTRAATTQAVEVIRERIREVPVVVPVLDDPIVRLTADQAYARAQAAQDRLRGTPGN